MTATKEADELRHLIDLLGAKYCEPDAIGSPSTDDAPTLGGSDTALGVFLFSFLLWETTTVKACSGWRRLGDAVVDPNELRICLVDELVSMLGDRYPRGRERAMRMKAALAAIYEREHAVTLDSLTSMGKREARDYLDSLDGVPPFVASRVMLVGMGGHAAPVDSRIAKALAKSGIVEDASDQVGVASFLERKLRAKEMAPAYKVIQAWADDGGAPVVVASGSPKGGRSKRGKG